MRLIKTYDSEIRGFDGLKKLCGADEAARAPVKRLKAGEEKKRGGEK